MMNERGLEKMEDRLRQVEARVESLAEIATLNVLKITTLTEVSWFARKSRDSHLTAVSNLIIAMDFPAQWWRERRGITLGEWWSIANVPQAQFRVDHAVGE